MEVSDLKLDEICFKEAPTKTQVVNTLNSIEKFLTKLSASILMDGSYRMGDQPVGQLLSAIVQFRAAADQFEGGPNASGLALPQPGPVPMQRR